MKKWKGYGLLLGMGLAVSACGRTKENTADVTIVNEKNTVAQAESVSVPVSHSMPYRYEDKGGVILVYEAETQKQELVVPDWKPDAALGRNYQYLSVSDVNFDGYDDLVYLYQLGPINAYYYAFLYHPDTETFAACEAYVKLANPQPDPKEQMIVATERTDGYVYYVTSYSWAGDTLVEEEALEVGVGDESGIYTMPETQAYTTAEDLISGEYTLGQITVGIILYGETANGADGEFMITGKNTTGVSADVWGDFRMVGDQQYLYGTEDNGLLFVFAEDSVQITDNRQLEGSAKADLTGVYWK